MKEAIYDREDYQQEYLPWATDLIGGEAATSLINMVQADRNAVINSTALFRPPLNLFTAELTLEDEEEVSLEASFETARLGAIAIKAVTSPEHFLVVLTPQSERWPVRYGDDDSKKVDQLVKKKDLRKRAELLVVRTSAAMVKHVVHRVPIGNIPEEALDWTISEGELQKRTITALRRAGIESYGDLGILSVNQLLKIRGLNDTGIEDIKNEFARRGWLSTGYK